MEAGALLARGKYRIEGLIGRGGLSAVYAARDTVLQRAVAIKLVASDARHTPELHERMFREARAVAQLESDHIVRILEIGETDDGRPFIVMERLDGRTLATFLASVVRVPYLAAVHYILQAAEGLAHAHQAGIVHRDVKPSNLFLARRANGQRVLKVLDFGIARSAVSGSITKQGTLGTPHYMSPEQMTNPRDVDPRTDVWSLGVTLFELLSGRLPFDGANVHELYINVFESVPPRLAALGVEVPASLDAVIARCLAPTRDSRIASVLELATALMPFAPPEARALFDEIRAASGPMPQSISPATLCSTDVPTEIDPDPAPSDSPLAASAGMRAAQMQDPGFGETLRHRDRVQLAPTTDLDPPMIDDLTRTKDRNDD